MKTCSQVCGIVFDPLAEGYVDVCDECDGDCKQVQEEGADDTASTSYYLGSCGLIIDYLL